MSKRTQFQRGCYYHIYNRGRSRLSICHEHRDYLDILKKMKKYSQKYKIVVIAYVLLPNHYHLLVRQDDNPRASLLPQRIFNSYSKIYNLKYEHSGTIFQGSAKSKLVDDPNYLRHLCRYIHANPVLHGLTRHLDGWQYTNLPEWLGTRQGTLVDHVFIEEQFGTAVHYYQFLKAYLIERHHLDEFESFLDFD